LAAQSALAEDGASLPIKKIFVDESRQVVVEFAPKEGAFPAVPHVLDLPGPNHRLVFDFADATVDRASLPPAEELSAAVAKSLPFVKALRYSNLSNTAKPTARVVLDLPENVKVKPRVVKLEEGQITISLGEEGQAPEVALADGAGTQGGDAVAGATDAQPSSTLSAPQTNAVASAPAASDATTSAPQAWDWSAGGQSSPTVSAPPAAESGAPAAPVGDLPAAAEPELKPAIPLAGAPQVTETPAPAPVEQSAPASAVESPAVEPVADSAPTAEPAPATPVSEAVPASEPGAQAAAAPSAEAATPGAEQTQPSQETEQPRAGEGKNSNLEAVRRYNSAVQAHLSGKLVDAVSEYQAALKLNPNLSEAHSNLGLIFNQQHNYAQALSEFRKALAINPRDAITYNGIGAALRAQKDLLGAIKNWQTAVSLDPQLATAHYNLGTAYEIQKDYDKALESYRQAVKNDYRLGEAYYRMGLIMERRHRTEEAAEQFSQALKVSSNSEYSEDARQRLAFLTQSKKTSKR
jgi:Tfp pilus assembly protein PilF